MLICNGMYVEKNVRIPSSVTVKDYVWLKNRYEVQRRRPVISFLDAAKEPKYLHKTTFF